MGYYMDLVEQSFGILEENKPAALAAIKNLIGQENIRDSSGPHFSWVRNEDFWYAETLEEALLAWRWRAISSDGYDIIGIAFEGQKAGSDLILFKAIAPFVVKDSYIQMHGEDGCMWRWYFNGETCDEQFGRVVWE